MAEYPTAVQSMLPFRLEWNTFSYLQTTT